MRKKNEDVKGESRSDDKYFSGGECCQEKIQVERTRGEDVEKGYLAW